MAQKVIDLLRAIIKMVKERVSLKVIIPVVDSKVISIIKMVNLFTKIKSNER